MAQHLVIALHFHPDGGGAARYHGMLQGSPEWPPAPARMYQALVAGASSGNALPERVVPALEWLETQAPPVIAAPVRTVGQAVSIYVPNNDADAVADLRDLSGIRTAKVVQPSLFSADQPLLYIWSLTSVPGHVDTIVQAAEGVYQLGRGVDMAWARAQVVDDGTLDSLLAAYRGVVHRPEPGAQGRRVLPCPEAGSLASLEARHRARRLSVTGTGRAVRVIYANPVKPRFRGVSYEPVRHLAVFELRDRDRPRFCPWPLARATALIEKVRDRAAARLVEAAAAPASDVERSLVGRSAVEGFRVSMSQRVQIIPLPSIGFVHVDRAIRRLLVLIPSGSPLPAADVEWAFSGLDTVDPETGEVSPWVLARSGSQDMLSHYVGPSRRWRSVTAVALPEFAARRRIDPARRREEAKGGVERLAEEDCAIASVHTALRHAGVGSAALVVRVQREPFEPHGVRAEAFAEGTRFPKERLWHVEVELDRSVTGPLLVGDGRFLGLGLMAPVSERTQAQVPTYDGCFALDLVAGEEVAQDQPIALARALRRAVMARVRDTLGRSADAGLDEYFSGHGDLGQRLPTGSRHLAFHWDAPRRRFLVLAPHVLERRAPERWEIQHLRTLDRALDALVELRAGAAGRFTLRRGAVLPADVLLGASRRWRSLTPYAVTRHRKLTSAGEALAADVVAECQRCGLPRPLVKVLELHAVPGTGLEGRVDLLFDVAVAGPIALGRTSLLGGGLFVPE